MRIWFIALFAMLMAAAYGQGAGIVREIIINGNQNVSREAILAAMQTKVGQPYVQATLDADKQTLEERGFFQAVDIQARALDADWQVIVNVVEYPVIKEIRVTGNKAVTTDEILKAVTLKPGDVYNLNARNPSVQAIADLYQRKGFFAQVESFAPLPDSPNTLNISIIEATVASVTVTGNTRTQDRVVRRLVRTRPGDPYNINRWESDLRRLYATQWFEDIRSQEEQVDLGKVALTANVTEARTGTINVGLQIDPRSSFAGFLRLTDTNFRGTGQTVGVSYLQTTRGGGPSIDLDYGNPFMDSRNTAMSASIYSRVVYRFTGVGFGGDSTPTEDDRYSERRTGASLGFSRELREDTYASISLRAENVKTNDLKDIDPEDPDATTFIQQDGDIASVTLGYVRNKRDTEIDPSRGDWLNVQLEPGYSNITDVRGAFPDESILGSNTFVKSRFEYRRYFSPQPPRGRQLDAPRRVLAGRLLYGRIDGEVPFFEQFFAGGSDTIRGYQEDRYWGRETFVATLEYRHPVQKALNIVGFVDYGGAWGGYGSVGEFTQSDKPKFHLGYGLGISFRTPLGPIRLDFGFNEKGQSRTHFIIGTSF